MDKRKAYPKIKASDFGKTHTDLIQSFIQKSIPTEIQRLQEQTNRTLKKIIKEKRKQRFDVIKNDINLKDTNGGNFGEIDELSKDGIGKIKTISSEDFQKVIMNKGRSEDFSELNALMHNSKIKKGYVHYVNQDNPSMQSTIKHKYNLSKYNQDLTKVRRVRSFVEGKMFPETSIAVNPLKEISDSDFASSFSKLQAMKKHSIVQAGLKTNNPFLRNMRRENRTVIEGMGHGWFGKTRRFRTPFGSQLRFGSYEDIIKLSTEESNELIGNSWGIDLETKSLVASRNSVIEAAFKRGDTYKALIMRQRPGFNLDEEAPFLAKSGFGDLARRSRLDFTKTGNASLFSKEIKAFHNSFKGTVEANVVDSNSLIKEVEDFVKEAKLQKKSIYIQNANFEINQLNEFFASRGKQNPLQYSDEYIKLREESKNIEKGIFNDYKSKRINADEALSKLVSNQKINYLHVLNEAKAGGKVVDVQEITKMLNAVAQQKGIQLKTGRFSANTNVDYLAKIFLNESELHEGVSDLYQQELIALRANQAIKEIETGNYQSEWTKAFIEENQTNALKNYKDNLKKSIISQLEKSQDPRVIKKFNQLNIEGFNPDDIFEEVLKETISTYQPTAKLVKSNGKIELDDIAKKVEGIRMSSLLFGGILLGSAITNFFTFSGRDDNYNRIEALKHGSPNQDQRKQNTSFGSGFQAQSFHQTQMQQEDPQGMTWTQLGLTGLGVGGAYAVFNHKAKKMRLSDLTYLGRLDSNLSNEQLLNRKNVTAQDLMVATIRRLENSLGGVGKSLGLGNIASYGMYDNAEFVVDLSTEAGGTYARYMDRVLKRKLIEEGVDAIMFKKGELFERINGYYKKIEGNFSLIKTVINHDLSDKISDFAKSAAYQQGINRLDHLAKQPFLIVGGEGKKAIDDFVNAYLHESISKPLKLLADPFEGLREFIPDIDENISPTIRKLLRNKYIPNFGADGKELVKPWTSMLGSHAAKIFGYGTLAYFGLGTLNWGVQSLSPDGTPMGDAGLIGLGAYGIRKAHELYARVSDITGLTSFRDKIEEKAPGSAGFQTTIGLTGAGALFGALHGGIVGLAQEAYSPEKYKAFIQSQQKTEVFEGALSKIFKSKYTPMGKNIRMGAAIGFIAALPFTLAGLGADSSASQLAAEYSGEKEVAVRKGRFWETGFTPFGGGEIDYYRPNWYAKLMDDAKNEELYGGNVSPLYEAMKTISDPYWREKLRYHSQPYPIAGPDGSMFGIFGPIYEASLGRILKPVATMHESVLPENLLDNTEYDANALLRKQWNATLEFMGLRGFAVKAIKENITGSPEIFADPNEARSAKDIDSIVRDFYDLQIGGGFLTTEALRRVFQNQDSFQKAQMEASVDLNPLKNMMPSWMPGSDYVVNFKSGDPFLKVKDGYYRLPGKGFASRYDGLKETDPENYPDIYKYKILADVAYGSKEFREIKGRLQNRELTDYEQDIFDQVENQVREKKDSEINVRDPKTYDSFLGRYSAFLTDLARSNPLETLLPISPAHKFLGPPDIGDYLDEQMYSKDYRSWSNPLDDFVIPTISMTMNSLGLGGIDMNDDAELYQDKMNFIEYSNMSRQAQSSGDLRSADMYTLLAQKTYTAKNLYSHPADVAASMPESERKIFNYFAGADVLTKQKMIGKVNPRYRDAYQAQLDMQMEQQIKSNRMSNIQRRKTLKEIQERREEIETRRKSAIQDLVNSGVQTKGGTGRTNYIQNRARDYHDYQPRKNATDNSLAQGEIPNQMLTPATYSDHYSQLNKSGIENALVVLRPGLDNSAKVNIKVNRQKERDDMLREWGYIA